MLDFPLFFFLYPPFSAFLFVCSVCSVVSWFVVYGNTMATIRRVAALAVKHHQAGHVGYAEEIYCRVLRPI